MPKAKHAIEKKQKKNAHTFESTSYLQGLFAEFHEQVHKYQKLTGDLLALEARIELCEKTMCLTRDHLAMSIARTEDAMPHAWNEVLKSVRFVGVRLADACGASLQEHKKMTPEALLLDLNLGMFRFRTNSPLREIHAALLRHPHVKRDGRTYIWTAPIEQQIPMRLRVVKREMVSQDLKEGTSDSTEIKGQA